MNNKIILLFIFVQYVCGILDTVVTALTAEEIALVAELNAIGANLNATYCSSDLILPNRTYVTLFVYTQASPNGTEVALADASRLTAVSPFNLELKTIFYSHGWSDCYYENSTTTVKDTLLKDANYNIIVVNWDSCSSSNDYLTSTLCLPDIAEQVGQFIETVAQTYDYSLDNITAVGHSLGAQLTGFIGKYLNGALGVILGLDPAGPLYYEANPAGRLAKTDAKYVQVMHTNALFNGASYSLGDSDFWPNGGYVQNGCAVTDDSCSHQNAWRYYVESLTNNNFYAKPCDSYTDYENGLCSQNSTVLMAGLVPDTSAAGDYYLDTNAQSPYGQGNV